MRKLYFMYDNEEDLYTLDELKQIMEEESIQEMEIYPAEPYKDDDYFWCKHIGEYGDKNELPCSTGCDNYSPRNGKSGCCRYYSTTFYGPGDKKIVLKKNETYTAKTHKRMENASKFGLYW